MSRCSYQDLNFRPGRSVVSGPWTDMICWGSYVTSIMGLFGLMYGTIGLHIRGVDSQNAAS